MKNIFDFHGENDLLKFFHIIEFSHFKQTIVVQKVGMEFGRFSQYSTKLNLEKIAQIPGLQF